LANINNLLGSFGIKVHRIIGDYVYEGKDDQGLHVIVKVCETRPDALANVNHPLETRLGQLKNEIHILTGALQGCVGVPRVRVLNPKNHIVLVETYLGLPLSLVRLPEDSQRVDAILMDWGRKSSKILHEIHSRGVIHRDVKPDNILVDDNGNVYLVDFGMSMFVKDRLSPETPCRAGTPAYGSDNYHLGLSPQVSDDFQSLGIALHALRISENKWFAECELARQKGKMVTFAEICLMDPVVSKLAVTAFPPFDDHDIRNISRNTLTVALLSGLGILIAVGWRLTLSRSNTRL
jgi:serine/threonine protein kinase